MANEFIVRILVGDYSNSSNKPKWEKVFTYIKHFLPLFAPLSSDGNYVILSYSLINGVLKENIKAPHNLATYPSTHYYTDVRIEGEGFMKRKGFYPTTEQARVILNRIEDFYKILFLDRMPDCILQGMIQIKPTNNMEKIKIDYVKKVVLSDTDTAVDAEAAIKHTAQRIDIEIMAKEAIKSEKEMHIKSIEKEYPLDIIALVEAKRDLKKIVKDITILKEIKSELQLSAN